MRDKTKERLSDTFAGVIAMAVAFFLKPSGWNVKNAFIWFGVFAAAYTGIRLVIMIPEAIRTAHKKDE
ncbi:hypothetical protein [Cutibacterium sp.]|uniref:hypothetical protein n=1 Tax=Cutibacterium sp. TaxID=1912221 RepID=UPI0026DD541D|nr:hypothetical protein [Cutibacterium sp.]MDO4412286.1 hypothetical protein [Cutibacterium sp.]